jgi:hypothetical protein
MARYVGPVPRQDAAGILLDLTEQACLETGPVSRECEAADAAEGVDMDQWPHS